MPKDNISWLSPRRRRTTGNLKTISNGQVAHAVRSDAPVSPIIDELSLERPGTIERAISQPAVPVATSADGNLFYAYARKGDELKSRYLLTFASAAFANEWWSLLQAHFPDASRPGAQLFSFKTDDMLSKAWRHPAFAHLKSKWMYISFSDARSDDIGGAAHGIIPVQDEHGNMLGGSAPASPSKFASEVQAEARSVKTEVQKLEEHFEKMMAAVERNTEKVADLATEKRRQRTSHDETLDALSQRSGSADSGSVDMGVLAGHFVRMNDLLSRNSQHVEALAKKHYENEDKLSKALEVLASKQNNDSPAIDRLTSHLDRIQNMMEASLNERKDSARDLSEPHGRPVQIDFAPLTDRLEKVQEAVEQNSSLVKALLEEGGARGESQPATPFWGKSDSTTPDFLPLTQHLQRIHDAIEQQSEHMKALVGYASGSENDREARHAAPPEFSLAPLNEHLEQIYNAIEEGNKRSRAATKLDLGPLSSHLQALHTHSQANVDTMNRLIESQDATRKAIEANGSNTVNVDIMERLIGSQEATRKAIETNSSNSVIVDVLKQLVESQDATRKATVANGSNSDHVDTMERLIDSQEATRRAIEANTSNTASIDTMTRLIQSQEATRKALEASANNKPVNVTPKLDLQPLDKHFQALRNHAKTNSDNMIRLLEASKSIREAVEVNGGEIDFSPMTEYLEAIRESSDTHTETIRELLASQEATRRESNVDFSPLADHLSAVRDATDKNSNYIKSLVDAQREAAKSPRSPPIDFTPMTDRLNRIHTTLEKQAERRDQSDGSGDPKFVMNALTSHLSKIQGVTDQNAQHVKVLREKQSSTSDKMRDAVSETSEQVRSLIQHNKESQGKVDAQNSQMRELMSGQREMVDVMRKLAKSVVAQNKGACDHVVIPPPRKMGRKVVGFVYDAKEGQHDERPARPSGLERSYTSLGQYDEMPKGVQQPRRPSGPERSFTSL